MKTNTAETPAAPEAADTKPDSQKRISVIRELEKTAAQSARAEIKEVTADSKTNTVRKVRFQVSNPERFKRRG
jgi:hypothetical protein